MGNIGGLLQDFRIVRAFIYHVLTSDQKSGFRLES